MSLAVSCMTSACSDVEEAPGSTRGTDDAGIGSRRDSTALDEPLSRHSKEGGATAGDAEVIDALEKATDSEPAPSGDEHTEEEGELRLFPDSRPYRTGRLKVSKIHQLYFELAGTPDGTPLVVLHGGPGGRAGAFTRQFFDPRRFKVLLFDQRGAGRSRPRAEYRENTTQLLIADIDALRDHLGFDEPVILFGGSWGSTLAVAYAETYPEKVAGLVLGGVFLCSKAEIDHFYHGGTAPFFPKNFAALQAVLHNSDRHDYPAQLFAMITGEDQAMSKRAIDAWATYEIRMTRMDMTDVMAKRIVTGSNFEAFSTLENHYMMNECFLEEGQLLRDAGAISHIPASIVNGRHDVICPPKTAVALARRIKRSKLEIVPLAAHSGRDEPLAEARLRGIDWVADQCEAAR